MAYFFPRKLNQALIERHFAFGSHWALHRDLQQPKAFFGVIFNACQNQFRQGVLQGVFASVQDRIIWWKELVQ
jgi:hypothetical protein